MMRDEVDLTTAIAPYNCITVRRTFYSIAPPQEDNWVIAPSDLRIFETPSSLDITLLARFISYASIPL